MDLPELIEMLDPAALPAGQWFWTWVVEDDEDLEDACAAFATGPGQMGYDLPRQVWSLRRQYFFPMERASWMWAEANTSIARVMA